MAPLGVDPVALDGAGSEVVTAAEGLASVISTLIAALSGCAGMAGDDPAGAALGHSYDSSASKLVDAMVTTRNGLCGLGIGVRMSAHNYSLAEAMSTLAAAATRCRRRPRPDRRQLALRRRRPKAVTAHRRAGVGWLRISG
ncbi:hypothetical protein ACTXG5_02355 [Mycobacterium sp. Dal123C01]|uniref:hypothetical protein n=1 Tax=Mycobacterium sp. Dal123C01 TaxID=3457577 RepID=UPI00403E6343